ncbi:hypothetical protein C8046_12460 [Serinibacter arcticus]|uniref:DUF3806 domain-containing protein n=1 Tax=Serinibacter arcticus TaxID=1655435 RepID=A0A2U1ZWR0_9MICO|nr:hypothetical protein [Serinibacter arcticus]PWD51352.1 hypothetical protein C8046_12460 [Serinibacter arcticus]
MPHISPLTDDVVGEILSVAPDGYARLGLIPEADPEEVLRAVEDVLHLHRRGGDELDRQDLITLGVVVGDVFVRNLGWEWANLTYPDGATAFAVLDETHAVGNQPMNWVYDIAGNANREIALVLGYNLVARGEWPPAQPGDALMLH